MSKQHGTPTQLGTVISAFITALCTDLMDFSITDIIKAIDKKGEKITQHLRLVLNAIMTGQDLALIDVTKDSKPDLLEPISTVNVAGTSKFVARDHFKLGEPKGVKIGYLGDDFKSHFLKKMEENVPEAQLKSYKLEQSSLDPPIITALGDKHETYLSYVWEFLKVQPKGEPGSLLNNGYANIFYIRDTDNILWVVSVRCGSGSWDVSAYSVDDSDRWYGDRQVFCR